MSFQIHETLISDCHYLGKLDTCHILLHRNATIPWFILVPETNKDWFDLNLKFQTQVMGVANNLAYLLKSFFSIKKINQATIGNVVPQLHMHIVGRHSNDACWPKPIWGQSYETKTYSQEKLECLKNLISRW